MNSFIIYNIDMGEGTKGFADWLFQKFIDWERHQPGKRSSYAAFARWLSENSYEIDISQPTISNWIAGKTEPSDKFIWILAEKLGQDVLQFFMDVELPDVLLSYVIKRWAHLPEDVQQEIHEMVAEYKGDVEDAHPKKKKANKTLPDNG